MDFKGLNPVVKALLAAVAMLAISYLADYIRDAIVFHRAFSPDHILNAIISVIMGVVTYARANKQQG